MQIYVGADHRGFELKNKLRDWLKKEGHAVIDVGAEQYDKNDDYPDYAVAVGEAVAQNPKERRGIIICGSGAGADVAANKVQGVRASLIHEPGIAQAARNDDDINVVALGANFISEEEAQAVIKTFLETPFEGAERYERRLNKIHDYEQKH